MALPVDPGTLFGVAMLVVGAIVTVVSLRYVWRTTRVVRAPDVASLDRVQVGASARLSGVVAGIDGRSVTAPFSGRNCVALEASVEERRPSVVVLPWFVTLWETQLAVPFRLRTAEDEVPVESPVHSVVLRTDDETSVGTDDRPPERIATFESDGDYVPQWTFWRDPPDFLDPAWQLLSLGTRRYRESALEVGDEVTVVGRRQAEGGVDPLVLSDRSPRRTFLRMVRTSLAGIAAGVVGLALGLALLLV